MRSRLLKLEMEKPVQCKNVFGLSQNTENFSRYELLKWINSISDEIEVKKVESLCSGKEYCLLMNVMFPGCIIRKKVNLTANLEHDYVRNFKVLQAAFQKVGCDKVVPVDRLVKGRFQDNFEFLQWFKKFFDANYDGEMKANHLAMMSTPVASRSLHKLPATSAVKETLKHSQKPTRPVGTTKPTLNVSSASSKSVANLEKELSSLSHNADLLLSERDFYYDKLKQIDEMCQKANENLENGNDGASNSEMKLFVESLQSIMYNANEEESFSDNNSECEVPCTESEEF